MPESYLHQAQRVGSPIRHGFLIELSTPEGSSVSQIRRLLLTLLLLALASGAIWAAFWQLRRLEQRRASNAILVAGRALAPIDLTEAIQNGVPLISGRQVIARGQFSSAGQFLLRAVHNEVPGMHVVTPFAISGRSEALYVLRGFVPAPDATTPPADVPMPDSGAVTLSRTAVADPVTNTMPVSRCR